MSTSFVRSKNDSNQDIQRFIRKVRPYTGLVLDFDDTLVCSEIHAAQVTANLINPFLIEAGKLPLTAEKVCCEYSGLNFTKQVENIQKEFGITIPPETITKKASENLKALSINTQAIHGSEELLKLLIEFKFNAAVLTASAADRVEASIRCAGLDRYLSTDPNNNDGRLQVVSAGAPVLWNGAIQKLPNKPDPMGYLYMAKKINLNPQQLVAAEDSAPGLEAAYKAGYGSIAIISLSRRCDVISGHVERMKTHIANIGGHAYDPERFIIIDSSWFPMAKTMFEIGLTGARNAGEENLPEKLPLQITKWLQDRLPAVKCNRPLNLSNRVKVPMVLPK